ncbi:MAG: diaminopimelate decarboxylase [Chloroflexi bacterium]|nr:diaminopimelate decarboxylase [Chloroflexota bacterium]
MGFAYINNQLCVGDVPLQQIVTSLQQLPAEDGNPATNPGRFYVYDLGEIEARYRAYTAAFPAAWICYAYKANSSLALAGFLSRLGAAADVVSGGELYIALQAGVAPRRIVFNGNGKTAAELAYAINQDIALIQVDAMEELPRLSRVAVRQGKQVKIGIRVNPNIDAQTHPHITTGLKTNKFGVPIEQAPDIYAAVAGYPNLQVAGIHCHIGSQITHLEPVEAAVSQVAALTARLQTAGYPIHMVNIGGGLGISYGNPADCINPADLQMVVPSPADLARRIMPLIAPLNCQLLLEPGRSLVAPAGALLTRVIHVKGEQGNGTERRRFVVVEAGMNDLIRPALYGAYHRIVPLQWAEPAIVADVVGPICESADVFGRDRQLPHLEEGDWLAILDAGAYGMSLASTYNGQPLPAEIAVYRGEWRIIRPASDYRSLLGIQRQIPW